MKSKLKGAQTGHDLLKRKSEALTKCVFHRYVYIHRPTTLHILDPLLHILNPLLHILDPLLYIFDPLIPSH